MSDEFRVRIHRPLDASPAGDVIKLAQLDQVLNPAAEFAGKALGGVDPQKVPEIGGRRKGLEATRYGDWEKNGRCIDF